MISLTSTGSGHKIEPINPPLSLTRGYKVGFNVSDTSLSSHIGKRTQVFDFELFRIQTLQIHILIIRR